MAKTVEKKQVCKCVNCGSEAEMTFTCTLEDIEEAKQKKGHDHAKVKGKGVCTHCGNEADMWIDV